MIRAFSLALGVTLLILGLECMVVKRAVLAAEVPVESSAASSFDYLDGLGSDSSARTMNKVIEPPEWAPWGLLSGGAVVTLYALGMQKS